MTSPNHALLICSHDGTLRRRVVLDARKAYAIGRSPRCEITLPSGSISRRHALAFCHAGVWRLLDTGSRHGIDYHGAFVRRCELALGELVGVGHARIGLEDPRKPARRTAGNGHTSSGGGRSADIWNARTAAMAAIDDRESPVRGTDIAATEFLLVRSARGDSRLFDLSAVDHATIGYDPLCRIQLECVPGLAPLHAVLFREPRAWTVVDAGGGVTSIDERFLRRRLAGDITVDLGTYRLQMIRPHLVEGQSGDIAPHAVSAFLPEPDGLRIEQTDD
ncbi:MAG: FHA domain-containing protein [Phycisphaerales bacterium]